MAKPPEQGKVKTRLARDVGDSEALKVYQALLHHTMEIASDSDAELQAFLAWEPGSWEGSFKIQKGESLGDKMWSAFRDTSDSGFDQMIMIGADCPGLTGDHINHAADLLKTHDLVLGPSEDGGYYLIGVNGLYKELFTDMPWSTEALMEATMSKADELGLRIHLLEELNDIDTLEDLEKSNFVGRWKG